MPTLSDLSDRFRRLADSSRKTIHADSSKPPTPPDPDAEFIGGLAEWLADDRALALFFHWLDREAEAALAQAHRTIGSPHVTSYALGFEGGIKHIRAKLKAWAER